MTEQCQQKVSDRSSRWPRFSRCERKAVEEVAHGVWLCKQHAKMARTSGSVVIETSGKTIRYEVDKDPELVKAQQEKWAAQERQWRQQTGLEARERLSHLRAICRAIVDHPETRISDDLLSELKQTLEATV